MVGAGQVFHVITEFRFDAGHAIAGTDALTSATENLSTAADHAKSSFQSLGIYLASSFGIQISGVIGALYTATAAADKFNRSQIAIANILGQSSGDTFEKRFEVAGMHMEKINKLANEFALPADEMVQISKLVMAMTAFRGQGGPERAISLTRNFLKAAPVLGISPQESMGQVVRAIGGGASMGDPLFQRLVSDTQAMGKFAGKTQAFNALPEHERVKLLTQALQQFTKDAKSLDAVTKSLSGQFQVLKNLLVGVGSILKPLGDVLSNLIIQVLQRANEYLGTFGKQMVKSLARAIEPFIQNPESAFVNYKAAKAVKGEVITTGKVLLGASIITGISGALNFFKLEIPVLSGLFHGLAYVIKRIESPVFGGIAAFEAMGTAARFFYTFTGIFTNFLGILLLLQIAFRSVQYAFIDMARDFAVNWGPRLAKAGEHIMRVFGILNEGMNLLAQFLSPIFKLYVLEIATEALVRFVEWIDKMGTSVMMAVNAIALALMEMWTQLNNLIHGRGFDASKIVDAWDFGMQDMFEQIQGKIESGDGVLNQNVNMNVQMKNEFKNQMEPDRIAFTIKDQLLKAATNKTQGAGTGMNAMAKGI